MAKEIDITLTFTPDLKNGKDIYGMCASCHLPEGWGNPDGTFPQIAGQHQNVLIQQLLNIRSGKRDNPTMFPFVQERTIGGYQSFADVVAYISTLPMNPQHTKGPWNEKTKQFKQGAKLFKKLCTACHGDSAQGNNETKTPKLYGQQYPYLIRQIDLISRNLRPVNPAMKAIIETLSNDEIKTIINYISWIEVPKDEKAPSLDWRNTDFY